MTILKDSKADVLNSRMNMQTQPLILANLTTAERDAIVGIVDGMSFLNITTGKVQVRISAAWVDLN